MLGQFWLNSARSRPNLGRTPVLALRVDQTCLASSRPKLHRSRSPSPSPILGPSPQSVVADQPSVVARRFGASGAELGAAA